MYLTLFPDFFPLENDNHSDEAQSLEQALCQIPLSDIYAHSEYRKVLKRLAQSGITTAWQLLHLQREEVAVWQGVGPVFLTHLDEMREDLTRQPQQVVELWHREHAKIEFPEQELEFEEELSLTTRHILTVEKAFFELLSLLPYRWPREGEALRRFFLEASPVDGLLKLYNFSSRRYFSRLLHRRFLRPLLQGEALFQMTISAQLLETMHSLRRELLFAPISTLAVLQHIAPQRFLLLLGLTSLHRSAAEQQWVGDFVVREGQIMQSRQILHRLMAKLQRTSHFCSLEEIASLATTEVQKRLLPSLLQQHPWIEQKSEGVLLSSPYLTDEHVRLQRLLGEMPSPLSQESLIATYEHRYLERPSEKSLEQYFS